MKTKLALSFILGCCSTFILFLLMSELLGAQGKDVSRDMKFIVLDDGVICDFPLRPERNLIDEECSCWYLGNGKGYRGWGNGCSALHLRSEDLGTLPKCGAR